MGPDQKRCLFMSSRDADPLSYYSLKSTPPCSGAATFLQCQIVEPTRITLILTQQQKIPIHLLHHCGHVLL